MKDKQGKPIEGLTAADLHWLRTARQHAVEAGLAPDAVPEAAAGLQAAETIAADLCRAKALLGVFDEGCMGMYNAIIPDELLHPTGIFKERLSQSTLYAAMQRVTEFALERAGAVGGHAGPFFVGNETVDLMAPFYLSRMTTIGAGTSEINRDILAKRVLRLPG